VEPSSTQAQQASPKEATKAPTEEQDKDLHEEEGAPPSSPVISTATNSSQDQDQPTHDVVVVKQHMPWDGLNGGRTRYWRIRVRGTS
jgi:hypothetical protein